MLCQRRGLVGDGCREVGKQLYKQEVMAGKRTQGEDGENQRRRGGKLSDALGRLDRDRRDLVQ
jgi:hypothetical protein